MLWATLAPLLKSTITSLALDTTDPLWQGAEFNGQQHAFVAPSAQVQIDIKLTSSKETSIGERFRYDPTANGGNGELYSEMHGQRDFTLNVQVKSYDLDYVHWAHEYAERIRTRIWRSSVTDSLIANNVTPVSIGPIVEVPVREDGQAVSVCNLDMFFRAGFGDTPIAGPGWIESIRLTSHVKNPGGTEYPTPPNLSNLSIP